MSKHFDGRYEYQSIEAGMAEFMEKIVGQFCSWYVYNPAGTEIDPVYDVGSDGTTIHPSGRSWLPPVPVPAINSIRTEGAKQWTDGLYTADTVHLILSSTAAQRAAMPDLTRNWRAHLKDRLVFHGQVFTPTRIELRGIIEDSYTVIGVDLIQVNPEELINDPDFVAFAV